MIGAILKYSARQTRSKRQKGLITFVVLVTLLTTMKNHEWKNNRLAINEIELERSTIGTIIGESLLTSLSTFCLISMKLKASN